MQRIIIALSLVALAAAPLGCGKKDKASKNPDEATEEEGDPLEALKNIPNEMPASRWIRREDASTNEGRRARSSTG